MQAPLPGNPLKLEQHLKLPKCPYCSVDNPNLTLNSGFITTSDDGQHQRQWQIYSCKRCGGVVSAGGHPNTRVVTEVYPSSPTVDNVLPTKVGKFLQQAMDSVFAPAGSVMLCACSVDAMLKDKGYSHGSLYTRIEEAINNRLLTREMGTWAHQVRLDANDQRHADENAELPTIEKAKQAIEFTNTLAELLYVLPSKVSRGIAASQ
jgi:hypothetical protein